MRDRPSPNSTPEKRRSAHGREDDEEGDETRGRGVEEDERDELDEEGGGNGSGAVKLGKLLCGFALNQTGIPRKKDLITFCIYIYLLPLAIYPPRLLYSKWPGLVRTSQEKVARKNMSDKLAAPP